MAQTAHAPGADLMVVVPYGNAGAQTHLAYDNREGDVTMCGRGCYGWSKVRAFAASDIGSAYTCKHCLRAITKAAGR